MKHVLIVDDRPIVCTGLRMLIQQILTEVRVHFANSFHEGIDALSRQSMDLILLDFAVPEGLGTEMLVRFRAIQPEVRILIWTTADEFFGIPGFMQSEANGFLHRCSSDKEIKRAIKAVLEDKKYLSDGAKESILSDLTNHRPLPVDPIRALTTREKQVLKLMLQGKWLKEIAKELGVQISTVGTQKGQILKKLNVKNMIELVRKIDFYAETGIVDLR